jgi:hypothetical protein
MFCQADRLARSLRRRVVLTICALSCAFFKSTQTSSGPSSGGVSPSRDTVPSQAPSMKGQIKKQ